MIASTTLFTYAKPLGWLRSLCALAAVVLVQKENFSHVEGVVRRRRRVWIAGHPLAPSPVAVAVLSESFAGFKGRRRSQLSLTCAHATCGCGLCESHGHQSVHAEVSEPSQASRESLPMGPQ